MHPLRYATILGLLTIAPMPGVTGAEPTPGSFAYLLQADSFAETKRDVVEQLAACDRDWIVLDAQFNTETPWTMADLDAIRAGKSGRRVIAYISIGEAEDYRPYWQDSWGKNGKLKPAAPEWLGTENPDWEGNYRVQYWQADWQTLILAAIDAAMERGFDGVYLDIVDGFETFEQQGQEFVEDRVNPVTRQSYRRDMVDWVKAVAARARAKNPAALVIPQNGSQLLSHDDFLAVVDGIGIEDLFTEGNKPQPKSHTDEMLAHLKRLTAAGKPVLLIEYPTNPKRQAAVEQRAAESGLAWLITDRPLTTLGTSGR
jgi:cysteinyl-tRNA synthetase